MPTVHHDYGTLPELETLPLETQELEELELLSELVVPEVLQLLVLEVLVAEVLELLGQVVLGELELETLRSLELLGLEEVELEALALEALELNEFELLTLELEPLLQPDSPLPVPFLTLTRPAVLQSIASLRLVLPPQFALVVAFLVRVLLLSLTHTELVDNAPACRLDYATALVAESASASPPSVRGECALGTDVLEDRQNEFECLAAAVHLFASMLLARERDPDAPDIPTPRSYAEAFTGPYSSKWQAAMDAEMASSKSTSTYVDAVPPSRANIVDGMWIFSVKRPPGSPPAFKARYVARGFSQQQGVDYFHTFSPTSKMTTLRVLLHVAAQRDYELHSLEFSTAFLQGSLHEEIWVCRPPGFTKSFPAGTHWSLRRPVYGLRHAPHKWHDTPRTTLAPLGFAPSTADPSLFLRIDMSLLPFYVLVVIV
ncbi:unnamed protein product [Closterium sp. NIES-53]